LRPTAQAEEKIAGMEREVAKAKEALDDMQSRLGSANGEISRLTKEVGELKGRAAGVETRKRGLETDLDDAQGKCRALEAAEERLRCVLRDGRRKGARGMRVLGWPAAEGARRVALSHRQVPGGAVD
jgi:chromosome segregation ATPase